MHDVYTRSNFLNFFPFCFGVFTSLRLSLHKSPQVTSQNQPAIFDAGLSCDGFEFFWWTAVWRFQFFPPKFWSTGSFNFCGRQVQVFRLWQAVGFSHGSLCFLRRKLWACCLRPAGQCFVCFISVYDLWIKHGIGKSTIYMDDFPINTSNSQEVTLISRCFSRSPFHIQSIHSMPGTLFPSTRSLLAIFCRCVAKTFGDSASRWDVTELVRHVEIHVKAVALWVVQWLLSNFKTLRYLEHQLIIALHDPIILQKSISLESRAGPSQMSQIGIEWS